MTPLLLTLLVPAWASDVEPASTPPPPFPMGEDPDDRAKACALDRARDEAPAGWTMRAHRTRTVEPMVQQNFLMDFSADHRYRFVACGGYETQILGFVVYDENARQIAWSEGYADRPTLEFQPRRTGSYFVALRTVAEEYRADTAVAMAVLVR